MRLLLSLLVCIFLLSCSKESKDKSSQETESTKEIIDKYVNTLTTAQDKAKKAAGAVEKRGEEEQKVLHETENP